MQERNAGNTIATPVTVIPDVGKINEEERGVDHQQPAPVPQQVGHGGHQHAAERPRQHVESAHVATLAGGADLHGCKEDTRVSCQ